MSASAIVADLDASARKLETRCGAGTMAWRIWGEGPPVVLGHGAQGGWWHWLRNIPALSAKYTVIAADLPGHGDSAAPVTPDHAGIARALAEGAAGVLGEGNQADWIGFSFGGVAFAHLAASHPSLVRRLVLVGCGGLDTPLGAIDLRRVRGLEGEERRHALRANLLGLMLHHPESADDLAIDLLGNSPTTGKLDVSGLVLPDRLLAVLPRVQAPVDAIWGEFDRPHPNPGVQAEALRTACPDAEFHVIPGAGHWAMYEQPDAFNAVLIEMLRSGPRRLKSGASLLS